MTSAESPSAAGDGPSTPFLLRLFYRTSAFHRLEDFASSSLPPHASLYVGPGCTLDELALELAAFDSSTLPFPAIGTRILFQLVFPDLRSTSTTPHSRPRFAVKELGSVVIGDGTPGAELVDGEDASTRATESQMTLGDAKFVVGDYISCAVLPPLADGSVAPASAAKREPAPGIRDSRGDRRAEQPSRGESFGQFVGRGGRQGRRDRGTEHIPMGEWRRGERLPGGPRYRRWDG